MKDADLTLTRHLRISRETELSPQGHTLEANPDLLFSKNFSVSNLSCRIKYNNLFLIKKIRGFVCCEIHMLTAKWIEQKYMQQQTNGI